MTVYLGKQQVAMTMNHVDESAVAQKVDKVTTPNIVYGTDSNGDQTTYDKNSFGQVDDVKVNGTSVVDNKVASITLGTMANETASEYTKTSDLATVATSGSYNDLSDKPTIPSAQVNSDWNATSGVAQILNKPTLGTMSSENTTSYYTKTEVDGKLDDKQDIATAVNYDNITNCITKIPQDIKLELNNGTLTLKAGSKVYVPNGFEANGTTPKFDEFITSNDIVDTDFGNDNKEVAFLLTKNFAAQFSVWRSTSIFSGTSTPDFSSAGYWGVWYDTANNIIKIQEGTNEWKTIYGFSLPFCLVSSSDSAVTSIDQVFNGFGYIGSTVFALPGVKGLIPNGRNADGSLKNIEFTTSSVIIGTATTAASQHNMLLYSDTIYFDDDIYAPNWQFVYKEEENIIINTGNNVTLKGVLFGKCITDSTNHITSFTPKTTFHALDYNDKSTISGWSMPSSRYIDLTLGASGATYTAPANGTVLVVKRASAVGQNLGLKRVSSNIFFDFAWSSVADSNIFVNMNVRKGEVFSVDYTASGTGTQILRFYYAEGDK